MKIVLFATTAWLPGNLRLPTALRVGSHGAGVIVLSPRGDFHHRYKGLGNCRHAPPANRGSLNPVQEAGSGKKMIVLLRGEQPDLMHRVVLKCATTGSGSWARLT